jgi:hypothetical protein
MTTKPKVPPRREAPAPALSISPEKVSYIIAKAREFDVKDVVTDPDSGSNAADDAMLSVLEDHKDDPVVAELRAAIFALNVDEQIDLVTLAWLGRGDGGVEDWDDCAPRRRGRTTRRPICSASRCCPTTSSRDCRSSASRLMRVR